MGGGATRVRRKRRVLREIRAPYTLDVLASERVRVAVVDGVSTLISGARSIAFMPAIVAKTDTEKQQVVYGKEHHGHSVWDLLAGTVVFYPQTGAPIIRKVKNTFDRYNYTEKWWLVDGECKSMWDPITGTLSLASGGIIAFNGRIY